MRWVVQPQFILNDATYHNQGNLSQLVTQHVTIDANYHNSNAKCHNATAQLITRISIFFATCHNLISRDWDWEIYYLNQEHNEKYWKVILTSYSGVCVCLRFFVSLWVWVCVCMCICLFVNIVICTVPVRYPRKNFHFFVPTQNFYLDWVCEIGVW